MWVTQSKSLRQFINLYHDKDLELAIRIAEDKFFSVFENTRKNKKKFKETELIFYRNGKVEHTYKDSENREKFVLIHQLALKKKDHNIYYNPSDHRYNKDGF